MGERGNVRVVEKEKLLDIEGCVLRYAEKIQMTNS
jgi:hypothetical protein